MRTIVALFVLIAGLWSPAMAEEPAEADETTEAEGPTLAGTFPEEPVLPSVAEELLTAELLGPPATVYDARTRTADGADPLVVAIEREVLGGRYDELAAPDSLRRYAAVMDLLMRRGRPTDTQAMFVAEHVGLSDVAHSGGFFITSDTEAADIAALIGPMVKQDARDPEVRAIALALQRDEEARLTTGTLWVLRGAIDFEPFPRTWEPGERASIPGFQVSRKNKYSLWVGFGGTEVKEFPIEGAEGRFDIEVPLPEEPGVYRVAMSVLKKRRMPDSPFFFSLYVGTELPVAYSSPLQLGDDLVGDLPDWEDRVVAAINEARAGYGLAGLEAVAREEARTIVAEAPDKTVPRYRYFVRRLKEDPLPDEPHGLWHPAFSTGLLPADVAWVALEHPISRSALLDPDMDRLVYGAAEKTGARTILLIALEPPPDAASLADVARAEVSGRLPDGLETAPILEAELDNIAARVASGKMPFRQYFTPIRKLAKKTTTLGGDIRATALVVPPGGEPDVSSLELPGGAKYIAVGDAMGDLGTGDGIQYTVLVVVVAQKAK